MQYRKIVSKSPTPKTRLLKTNMLTVANIRSGIRDIALYEKCFHFFVQS